MRQFADTVVAAHGSIDVVVNTVGITQDLLPLAEIPRADCERVMQVNFWGMVNVSLTFLPYLLTRSEPIWST